MADQTKAPPASPRRIVGRPFINPTTGRPWTLADPEISAELDREACEMSRDDAVRFLQQIGLLTKSGNLSSRYYSKAEIEQHRRKQSRLLCAGEQVRGEG